jgi:hypothetical protein
VPSAPVIKQEPVKDIVKELPKPIEQPIVPKIKKTKRTSRKEKEQTSVEPVIENKPPEVEAPADTYQEVVNFGNYFPAEKLVIKNGRML